MSDSLNSQLSDFSETVQMPPIVTSRSTGLIGAVPQAFQPPAPAVLRLESYDGTILYDHANITIQRTEDAARAYRSDLAVIPIRSLNGARLVYGDDDLAVISFDVILPNGERGGYLSKAERYASNLFTLPIDDVDEAQRFIDTMKADIKGERTPIRHMPFQWNAWWQSPWPWMSAVLLMLLVCTFVFGHAFVTPSPGAPSRTQTPVATASTSASETPSPSESASSPTATDTMSPSPSTTDTPTESPSPSTTAPAESEADKALSAAQQFKTQPVSRKTVIQQLTNNGYSQQAAETAADQLGVDWAANALRAAKIYQSSYGWNASQISGKLVADGFTADQVNKAISQLN